MPLRLEIVTPERLAFAEDVDAVVCPGIEGELGILPHHAPLLTTLGVGELLIPVGLPFFVDATIADEFLVAYKPVIRLRAYGEALHEGDPGPQASSPGRGDQARGAGPDHQEGPQPGGHPGRGARVGQAQAVAEEDREPRPHRVQLPHVAEVAKVGQAHAGVGERAHQVARLERATRERERAVGDQQLGRAAGTDRDGGRRSPVARHCRADRF